MRTTNKVCAILGALSLSLLAAGCGSSSEDRALDAYRQEMEHFYDQVSAIHEEIDAIDPERGDSVPSLLDALDRLQGAFDDMAQVEIPEEFSAMGDLPREAADYMEMAVESYHEAYTEPFDEEMEETASQYYERANIRIRYMLSILHGDTEDTES